VSIIAQTIERPLVQSWFFTVQKLCNRGNLLIYE